MFNDGDQCQNRFCVLHTSQDIEEFPDIVMGMFLVFEFDKYALLDSYSNFSFVVYTFPYDLMCLSKSY